LSQVSRAEVTNGNPLDISIFIVWNCLIHPISL
jgi:hypothetical protein